MLLSEILDMFFEGKYDSVMIEDEADRVIYSGTAAAVWLSDSYFEREVEWLAVRPAFNDEGETVGATLRIKLRKAL